MATHKTPTAEARTQTETARWRRRKDARPQEILEAALSVFAERGFAAARMEQIAAVFLQFFPAMIRIYFAQCIRHSPASPQRDAQIMNVIGFPSVPDRIAHLDDAIHPHWKSNTLRRPIRG